MQQLAVFQKGLLISSIYSVLCSLESRTVIGFRPPTVDISPLSLIFEFFQDLRQDVLLNGLLYANEMVL
jgi:hypothetical protein